MPTESQPLICQRLKTHDLVGVAIGLLACAGTVLAADPDSTDLHLADTLAAGAGLCDPDAVRVLVDEGPGRVNELIALGAMFDRDSAGNLELARCRTDDACPIRASRSPTSM